MNNTMLMAATAVLALTAGNALAHPTLGVKPAHVVPITSPGKVLYNQNSNFGYGIVSQNFTSNSAQYDAAAADDFLVPKGKIWKITAVDVTGVYFNGSGPAPSETVTFYADSKGHPGKAVGKGQTLSCTDSAGSFACTLPKPVKLDNSAGTKKARYWLSVTVNMAFGAGGEWGWVQNTVGANDPGQWENPGNGYATGCTTWNATSSCIPTVAPANDYAFELLGK